MSAVEATATVPGGVRTKYSAPPQALPFSALGDVGRGARPATDPAMDWSMACKRRLDVVREETAQSVWGLPMSIPADRETIASTFFLDSIHGEL